MIKKYIIMFALISSTINLTGTVTVHQQQNREIKRSDNSHVKSSIKLAFHVAKIVGALGLVYGNIQLHKSLEENSEKQNLLLDAWEKENLSSIKTNSTRPKTISWDEKNGTYVFKPITPSSYFFMRPLTFALAAYLVYDGCSGICKTIKNWNSNNEIRVHRKQ